MMFLAALVVAPLAGAQQANAGADVAPFVLILLDNSGSMSYIEANVAYPVCTTALVRDADLTYTRSRDMVAKEVLTGSFSNDFWCRQEVRPIGRYDAGYPIPWFTPQFVSQSTDGILDTHGETIKFGLATFDAVFGNAEDQTGGFSYGDNAQGLAGVGITNLGIQNVNALAGKLMIPVADDAVPIIKAHNELVQRELLKVIPYGGTPISPALTDVAELFIKHGSLVKKNTNNNGDPFQKCRTRNVLLITDGRPNMGENNLGYATSVKAAEELNKLQVKTYVVGFNIDGGSTALIDQIAAAGGTVKAQLAASPTELTKALSEVLQAASPGLKTLSEAVFTNITNSSTDLQYQINTAYSGSSTSKPDYTGYTEITAYRCEELCKDPDSGGAGACEVTELRKKLGGNESRTIQVVVDGELVDLDVTKPKITPELLGMPLTGTPTSPASVTDGLGIRRSTTTYDPTDPAQLAAAKTAMVDFIHAKTGSRRGLEKLGGSYRATPVIQTNLQSISVPIPSYQQYKASIATRGTMMYQVTHDGLIHAFHLSQPSASTPTGINWLDEVWAILPQHLAKKTYGLVNQADFLMDGTPTLKDIRIRKTTSNPSLAEETKLWRSVLVVPYRNGRGMIAIDVTDPFSPYVRWEIDNKRHCWADTADDTAKCKTYDAGSDASDYRNLGNTQGRPRIGTVFVKDTGTNTNHEVAAVFFGCGDNVTGDAIAPDNGKCFMVSRLDTGHKIKEFKNGDSSVLKPFKAGHNLDTLDFDIVGDPAVYNTFVGTLVSRAFVGDEGGQLWRIDVSSTDVAKWTMSLLFDVYDNTLNTETLASTKRAPLRSAPAMSPVAQRGQLALVFGSSTETGNTVSTSQTVVFSIKEKLAVDGTVTHDVLWQKQLQPGENLTSKPLIFGRVAYFTSYKPDATDACKGGEGRIWGLDFIQSKGVKEAIGSLDSDGDTTTTGDTVEYISLEDSIPSGVSLVARPACSGNQGVSGAAGGGGASNLGGDSALKSSKAGQLELVVQTGNSGQSNAAAKPAKGGAARVNKFALKVAKPAKQVISISWGQVQNL